MVARAATSAATATATATTTASITPIAADAAVAVAVKSVALCMVEGMSSRGVKRSVSRQRDDRASRPTAWGCGGRQYAGVRTTWLT